MATDYQEAIRILSEQEKILQFHLPVRTHGSLAILW